MSPWEEASQMNRFRDRAEAGRRLAAALRDYADADVVVLALPRGGVPVAYEVARALDAPLDVYLVRKLGVAGREELAMGAIASGGVRVLNQQVLEALRIGRAAVDEVARRELRELQRREAAYRRGRGIPDVRGSTVILVDDGLATGSTMRAAVAALRRLEPADIVAAVPVAPPRVFAALAGEVDRMVCLSEPEEFVAVGAWYDDFAAPSDVEIVELLEHARRGAGVG